MGESPRSLSTCSVRCGEASQGSHLVTFSFAIGSIIPISCHRRDRDVPAWRLAAAEIVYTASRMASSDVLPLLNIVYQRVDI